MLQEQYANLIQKYLKVFAYFRELCFICMFLCCSN